MEDQLIHTGVLGMKWGVTRAAVKAGSDISGIAKNAHSKKVEGVAKATSKKEASTMSEAQLRERVNRMNLEEQYTRLSSSEKQQGKDRVSAFLDVSTAVLGIAGAALSVVLVAATIAEKLEG